MNTVKRKPGRTVISLSLAFLSVLWAENALGAVLQQAVKFNGEDIQIKNIGTYRSVTMSGFSLNENPGDPQLPAKTISFVLPAGALVRGVKAVSSDERVIAEDMLLYPAQKPAPRSQGMPAKFQPPNQTSYGTAGIWPQSQAGIIHQGRLAGYEIASVKIYPLRYHPLKKQLLFSGTMLVELEYDIPAIKIKIGQNQNWRPVLTRLVSNPGHLDEFYPPKIKSSKTDPAVDYLIITKAPMDTVFRRLLDWKKQSGLRVKMILADSIYAGYGGRDQQEKIRNYLKEKQASWSLSYVLLGGDTDIIPARVAFAFSTADMGYGGNSDSLRADIYYAALDGAWDGDGDGIFGETTDSVDLYPDLLVGRAPANTVANAQAFVNKVIGYEKNPEPSYLNTASFWAEMLDPETDGGHNKDMIAANELTDYFKPAEKLYESLGNESRASVIATINGGAHLMNHDGHADYDVMCVGPDNLILSDFDGLANGPKQGILYSLGCLTAAIDYDCMAERFVNNPGGGGVAFAGNSRFGWYMPGFAGYGSSDLMDQRFFRYLIAEDAPDLGSALVLSKLDFTAQASQENDFRWLTYGINLLGDPGMAVWTAQPESLSLVCPDTIPPGKFTLRVTVLSGGNPLAGTMVALTGDSLFARGVTDASGSLVLNDSIFYLEPLVLTATARNRIPAQKAVTIASPGPRLTVLSHSFTELTGDFDLKANAGERMAYSLLVKNTGDSATVASQVLFRPMDSLSKISDSLGAVGPLGPGDSLWLTDEFTADLDSNISDGQAALYQVIIDDGLGRTWNSLMAQVVDMPVMAYQHYVVSDALGGDGDMIPEPGENIELAVRIKNTGHDQAGTISGKLSASGPYLTVADSLDTLDNMSCDSSGNFGFALSISSAAPVPNYSGWLYLETMTDGRPARDSFLLTVGATGFADDMESGDGSWQYGSYWHRSAIKSASPVYSWYCGNESDTLAPQDIIDTLSAPVFYLGQDFSLSFNQWHDLVSGWDYGFVEAEWSGGKKVLTTVTGASGGWQASSYDLSFIPAGSGVTLRFILAADSIVGARSKGWFIDDVNIFDPQLGVEQKPDLPAAPCRGMKLAVRPNPFRQRMTINYQSAQAGRVTLKVYNIAGQLVRKLVDEEALQERAGTVGWDGRDDRGVRAAQGMYFIRLMDDQKAVTQKVILLK
ncbi:T9SS type A sorting domain-containing protein [candidate division TA06 bacterium]|uniref:T9SS type A sorting domain-containing protein n=1 Tax=candidate division TA06 bacterium TaxID=2250710 RepID=A0A933IAL4_UNCT6|nr:T9SS type A sorting domain-containing protein [candidate division TA06 bacterium]